MTLHTPQRQVLSHSENRRIVLTWYPPGHTMAAHAHDSDQRSVLLAGSLEERAGAQVSDLGAGVTGYKAAGVDHANRYGRDGALILALDGRAPEDIRSKGEWRWGAGQGLEAVRRILGAVLDGSVRPAEAANDLEALVEPGQDDALVRGPTPWLIRAKAVIDSDPASARVDGLAAEAGVHRVHFSRSFAAAYGTPLSVYRRRAMTAKAVRSLLQEREGAGVAAAEAGFADQAHFTRALKAETGLTPARLAAALG